QDGLEPRRVEGGGPARRDDGEVEKQLEIGPRRKQGRTQRVDRDEEHDRRGDDPRHVEDRLAPGLGWLHLHAPQSPTPARRTRPPRLSSGPAGNGTARLTLTKGFSAAGLPLGHAACTIASRT